jgi:excinuclease ABC subunit A
MTDKIVIKGAREHNLKNISVSIPKNKLVVFTGVSGSGKSSLALDTIYAEGKRRYVESLSAYARQFLGRMKKPEVDTVEGLSPAIAVSSKTVSANPRSTVGTITEVYDFLRLLFAKIGHPRCPSCGREISCLTSSQIVKNVWELISKRRDVTLKKGARIMILSPLIKGRKGEYSKLFENLRKKGFSRVRVDGAVFSLEEELALIKTNRHTIEAVVDRMVIKTKNKRQKIKEETRTRLADSIETALRLSDGEVIVSEVRDATFSFPEKPKKMLDHLFSTRFACPVCNLSLPEIEPRTFSFNSPFGACPTCSGLGTQLKVEPDLLVNKDLSIAEGGVLPFPWLALGSTWFSRTFLEVLKKQKISIDVPFGLLSQKERNLILYGTSDHIYKVRGLNRRGKKTIIYERFLGVISELERRYQKTTSDFTRREIEKYMRRQTCPDCGGSRLKKEALFVTIGQKNIIEVTALSIKEAFDWVKSLKDNLGKQEKTIAETILRELKTRLLFLSAVGLDYLTLERRASTLAVGEAQRMRLASQVGSGLTGVLYILDEPTVGLHARDNDRLITTLKKLRDLGNTVIVVEHDPETIKNADWILDFGPEAGRNGGKIVVEGTIEDIRKAKKSLTGDYLAGRKKIEIKDRQSEGRNESKKLTVLGASEHNLKNIDLSFPLGKFICVTGVSGSGKSTLVDEILYRALAQRFYRTREKPGEHKGLVGSENIDKVVLVDQSPIGRTPRSNPATYTGVFTPIREIFSQTLEARVRGYKKGRFSFNIKSGRCEVCQGEGQIKIEMQFLPDIYIDCEVCRGKRYKRETLEVTYKEKNIADILSMTVEEALEFFAKIPKIAKKLQTLFDVGLSYIQLGQPAPTLSGGEAQRVKLAAELSKKPTGHTFYILDEPTTGLHFEDLKNLLIVLRRFVNLGNTVVVIEHNLDVIKNADWIIDLGPEGGDKGGQIVAQGTPREVALNKNSYTGRFLKRILFV